MLLNTVASLSSRSRLHKKCQNLKTKSSFLPFCSNGKVITLSHNIEAYLQVKVCLFSSWTGASSRTMCAASGLGLQPTSTSRDSISKSRLHNSLTPISTRIIKLQKLKHYCGTMKFWYGSGSVDPYF